jgi:hypothetical protein
MYVNTLFAPYSFSYPFPTTSYLPTVPPHSLTGPVLPFCGTRLNFDYCVLLELRHLRFCNIIKLKQVWLLDILGYGFFCVSYYLSYHKHAQWKDGHNTRAVVYRAEIKTWKMLMIREKACRDT